MLTASQIMRSMTILQNMIIDYWTRYLRQGPGHLPEGPPVRDSKGSRSPGLTL